MNKKRLPSDYKFFFRALRVSVRIKSPMSIIVSILGFAAAFLPMAIALALYDFTDLVQSLAKDQSYLKNTLYAFAVLAVLYILQTFYTFLQNHYFNEDSSRIKRYIKEKLIDVTTDIPYKYIENYDSFREKVNFIKEYAGHKVAGSVALIFGCISYLISFFSLIKILSHVSWWIVISLIITCIPAVILSYLQKDEDYRLKTKWMKEGAITIHYSGECRNFDAMKDIRFFGLYDYLKKKWRSYADIYIDKKNKITKKHVIYNSIADLLRNSVYIVILLITAHQIYQNPTMGIGVFMLVITAAGQLQTITTKLLINAFSAFSDVKYMKDFFELIDTEKESVDNKAAPYDNVDIEFKNVTFRYPNADYNALNGVNVKIRQGEKIAIVGANGSGKSTFVNLLCGLYECTNGNATINDEPIYKNLSKVRRSMSVIFQNFCHYEDTVKNNITVSDPLRSDDDDEIISIAAKTGVDEIVHEYPNGFNEIIGSFNKNGINLSGGQWQKVAIARALFRKDTKVYVLDEPTSALDPISEASIYRNFTSLTGDKTTILISHRLGITSVVDRILVFDNGKIVEEGSHNELMKLGGIYSKMYDTQAKWYQ